MSAFPKLLSLFVLLVSAACDARAETLAGPVEARVLRVVDGDTFIAEAMVWPGHRVEASIRIRGIDAPELRSRCTAEKRAALRARGALERLIGGRTVQITNIGGGKYYGRVIADAVADGTAVGPALLALAVVRAYDGGRRVPFCNR